MNRIDNELFSVVIVSYNPDERLLENISVLSSSNQINDILIIDNSTSINGVVFKCSMREKVTVVSCNGNKGIAYAQNVGILKSKKMGYKWTLLLDQDSIVCEKLINKYKDFINKNMDDTIAIVSTDYYDVKKQVPHFNNLNPIYVNLVISSGSLLNIDICIQLGGMKEEYFIDQVDNEYCYRIYKSNFRIIVLPGTDMEHQLGNLRQIKLGIIRFYTYNQNPERTFFRTRNSIYFLKEYGDITLSISIIKTLMYDCLRILFEKERLSKIRNFGKGLLHGFIDKLPKKNPNQLHE